MKVEISCVVCLRAFKRAKFRSHKCDRALTQEEIEKRKEENKLLHKANEEALLADPSPVQGKQSKLYDDKPFNHADFEAHWRKKTKGRYMLGLGRWFRVCRQNLSRDIEAKTKLFQSLMMTLMGIISIALTIFLLDACHVHDVGLIILGFTIEYCLGFLAALVGYGVLANQWEGYYNHKCLKTIHCLALIFLSTIIPHGDFLLHLGYYQRGYQKKGQEETFPDGYELSKKTYDLQGYLSSRSRGGFNTFFMLGYIRCFLAMSRMITTIGSLTSNELCLRYELRVTTPLVLMMFGSYIFFNFLMLLKLLIENNTYFCLTCIETYRQKRKAKKLINKQKYQSLEEEEPDQIL